MKHEGAEVYGWVERLVSWSGGLAGLGTALAAGLLAIWRHGYRAGQRAERARRMEAKLDQLTGGVSDAG
jgi:hypothetical protein